MTSCPAAPVGVELLQELERLDRLAGLGVGEQSEAGIVGVGAGSRLGVMVHAVFNGTRPGQGTGRTMRAVPYAGQAAPATCRPPSWVQLFTGRVSPSMVDAQQHN
ncbi:hypothetical protein [Streptomyces sp. TLI_105]|uniref:hypothetical protein n=1 Tax=Streptomyces sp. TLI_105 TaxID=1881019 RepID=UPI0008969F2B|nr:hypothetical protein [Streptomyces sp. TLI_105]SEB87745.1 hypothetical protein SAMN05428939_0968 [Streptomyces sp. TLI_105]